MRYLSILIFSSMFCILLLASMSSNEDWRYGIVVLRRSDNFAQQIQEMQNLPKKQRCREVIKIFKKANESSLSEFLERLHRFSLDQDIEIEKSLWIGNTVRIRYRTNSVLASLMHLPNVIAAFEDVENFRIFETTVPADAMDVVWGVQRIGAPSCWSIGYRGQNVLVAVLDSGIRYTHNDLQNRMWHNPGEIPGNSADDDGNGYIDDYYGYDTYNGDGNPWDDNVPSYHGTHCAGTVAGDGTGGTQTGVAPEARLMAVKVTGTSGSGSASALAEGIQYALDNGADVLSISLGWSNPSNEIKNYMRPIMEDVLSAGVIAAVAAGNDGGEYLAPQDITCPGDCPSPWRRPGESSARTAVITVGATNSAEQIASFSSYGPTHWNTGVFADYPYPPGLLKPDVCAPGVSIVSTYGANDYGYYSAGGTSMSTPHVAGACAVMLSKNPSLEPWQIDSILQTTALELGPAGKDSLYGSGRIRLDQAIAATPTPTFPIISVYGKSIDDPLGNHNHIADPGEQVDLYVAIFNAGANATGVSATISEWSPYLSIIDNSASYGSIALGTADTNSDNPFILQISPSAPPGYSIPIAIHIIASGGYSWDDTFSLTIASYPRQTADIDVGSVTFTLTNFGEVGFYNPQSSSSAGSGFVYGGYNYLYGGSFFLGFSYNNVATGDGGGASELTPVTPIQSFTPGTIADEEITCSFVDPDVRVRVDLFAMGFASPPDDDFVLVRYIVRNISTSMISNLYAGLYLDYDITYVSGTGWYDKAVYSSVNEWGYMWDSRTPPSHPAYVGIVGITDISRGSVVHNPTHVYPTGMGWNDTVKYNFLSGAFFMASGDSGSDWSLILADGPFSLLPGRADTFVYAVVAGNNLSDFIANATRARTHLARALFAQKQENPVPSMPKIIAYPNPFNTSCKISMTNTHHEKYSVEIIDISGKVVVRFEEFHSEAGIVWQPSENLPAGLFFVKVSNKNFEISRKILLIK